jgi:imidazolonepropionase-like amidohydrolase
MSEAELGQELAACVSQASRGAWNVGGITRTGSTLLLTLDGAAGPLTLEIHPAAAGRRAYRNVGDHGFSYRATQTHIGNRQLQLLDATIAALGALLRRLPAPLAAPAETARDERADGFPTPYHRYHLESELLIPAEAIAEFRRDGHVVLRGALQRNVVLTARPLLIAALKRAWPREALDPAARQDAYSQAFVQIVNLGLDDDTVRAFTHSRRLGKIAADLMGVSGARIYSEDWLLKEPGARITPWHQDAAVYPMHTEAALTIWVPIQDVLSGMGLVRFARGSHRFGIAPVENISDISEEMFSRIIAEQGFAIDECTTIRAGDISVHDGRTIHAAHQNDSGELRVVLALHSPTAPGQAPNRRDGARLADLAPELQPGDPAAGRKWPLLYSAKNLSVGRFLDARATPAYHLRATLLPDGQRPVDLWIQDGRLHTTPIANPQELETVEGFAIAGLVDAHSHVSWPHDRETPAHATSFMDEIRANHAATGVTLLRDMGSAGDDVLTLGDRPGYPRVQASGMLVLRFDHFPFTSTPPDALRRVCVERVERGARWVKVFSDWSSDYSGKENTGFAHDDELTYPLPVLAEAVAAVHEAGGRVAAHCFTRPGAEVAIRAGCDSIEHGWGVDEALIDEMAARGIAWAPLLGIATPMWRTARRYEEAERVDWIERCMDRLATLLPLAQRRGAVLLAGTDWFPEVTVADEVAALHACGVSATAALAAGSWAARRWLGEPDIEDGAPADLVVYRDDPRSSLEALQHPALILIGGHRTDPAMARIRPRRLRWTERSA